LSRDFIYKRRIRETNAGETNTTATFAAVVCCHGVIFLLGEMIFLFLFLSFLFFRQRAIFFSQILRKKTLNGLTTENPRQETEKRSGERDLKTFDLSLSLKKDGDSLFCFAL
jgi:hypothetical protein